MDYREAVIDCVEYLREGYKIEGFAIFNNVDLLKENLKSGYLIEQRKGNSSENHFPISITIDSIIGSVISEIFGDLYIMGEYNFNVVDNALAQLHRKGLISNYSN